MPRQLANRPRAHPPPLTLSRRPHAGVPEYPVLITLSRGYPGAGGRLPTCYSAVRHSIHAPKCVLTVRLACVRRAASVHPEPGSNSPFSHGGLTPPRASESGSDPSLRSLLSLLGLIYHLGKGIDEALVAHSPTILDNSAVCNWRDLVGRGIRFSGFVPRSGRRHPPPRRRARS